EVRLPPLREREGDVLLLARRFLERAVGPRPVLGDATADLIRAYRWPGNVRELKNAMERASIFARGLAEVEPRHLPAEVRGPVPASIEPLAREGRLLGALDHPRIVRALSEVEVENDVAFYAMEFVAGRDLRALLRSEGPLAPARAVAIAADILEALAFAHDRGV